jgi:hypothetical protein
MRQALLSVAVGLAGAAALAGAGWTLEAASLPPPEHADRVAARAIGWLTKHPVAVDVFHAAHHRLDGACVQGRFRGGGARKAMRGTLVSLRPGPVVVLARHSRRIVLRPGAPQPFLPTSLAADAGCPGRLASTLDSATRTGGPVRVERSYAANQPALKLVLRRLHGRRLTLYVSPRGDRPLVAIVDRNGKVATARLYVTAPTPRARRRFDIPPPPRRRAHE